MTNPAHKAARLLLTAVAVITGTICLATMVITQVVRATVYGMKTRGLR